MSTSTFIGLVIAGALGAPSRYLLDGFVQDRARGDFPWGTFVINISGSFLIGLIAGAALYHAFSDSARVVLGTGFCGAYTTFSTYAFESVRLAEQGATRHALANVLVSAALGTAAAGLGLALAAR